MAQRWQYKVKTIKLKSLSDQYTESYFLYRLFLIGCFGLLEVDLSMHLCAFLILSNSVFTFKSFTFVSCVLSGALY